MKAVKQFIEECQNELKKVVWPDKNELTGSTWVVIISVIILTAIVGSLDYVFTILMRKFFG